MNKRYIDFVPVSGERPVRKQVSEPAVVQRMPVTRGSSSAARSTVTRTPVVREVPKKPVVKTAVRPAAQRQTERVYREMPKEKPATKTKTAFSLNEEPKFGVIEDLNTKFVKTEVEKRPLSSAAASTGVASVASTPKVNAKEVKSRKIGGRRAKRSVEKSVEKANKKRGKKDEAQTFKTPRTPFINQEKVAKRPLSKNVYQKKIEPTKEKESGPITIISKPEKDSHVGIVVAIILTVVLGAAAGTIAFLLLPK